MASYAAGQTIPPTANFATCSWDHPGINPFMGDLVEAIDRYQDISAQIRKRLQVRMARRDYDDLVVIRRDSISGKGDYVYGANIREMHFGTHQLCHRVTRSSWTSTMEEMGLVYCESGECILVPTVCRNVSRIVRHGSGTGPATSSSGPVAAPPVDGQSEGAAAIDWFGPTGSGGPVESPLAYPPVPGVMDSILPLGSWTPTTFLNGATSILLIGVGESLLWVDDEKLAFATPAVPDLGSAPVEAVPEPQTAACLVVGVTLLIIYLRIR